MGMSHLKPLLVQRNICESVNNWDCLSDSLFWGLRVLRRLLKFLERNKGTNHTIHQTQPFNLPILSIHCTKEIL